MWIYLNLSMTLTHPTSTYPKIILASTPSICPVRGIKLIPQYQSISTPYDAFYDRHDSHSASGDIQCRPWYAGRRPCSLDLMGGHTLQLFSCRTRAYHNVEKWCVVPNQRGAHAMALRCIRIHFFRAIWICWRGTKVLQKSILDLCTAARDVPWVQKVTNT